MRGGKGEQFSQGPRRCVGKGGAVMFRTMLVFRCHYDHPAQRMAGCKAGFYFPAESTELIGELPFVPSLGIEIGANSFEIASGTVDTVYFYTYDAPDEPIYLVLRLGGTPGDPSVAAMTEEEATAEVQHAYDVFRGAGWKPWKTP